MKIYFKTGSILKLIKKSLLLYTLLHSKEILNQFNILLSMVLTLRLLTLSDFQCFMWQL